MSSTITRRICVEFLSPDALARPQVVALLSERQIAPLAAAQADGDDENLIEALVPFAARGLEVGLWPLLSDAQGYWPSLSNAERFAARVHAILDRCDARGLARPWILVDLEPGVDATEGLRHGSVADALLSAARTLLVTPTEYAAASDRYRRLAQEVRARGARTLATAYPFAAGDARGQSALAARCAAPLDVGWDRVSVMTYGSLLSGYSRGTFSVRAARWYAHRVYRRLAEHYGAVGAFVGIVGHGKLGDERSYTRPEDLAADTAAAIASGAVDISGYCLEGILDSRMPERWLDALATRDSRRARFSVRGELMHSGVIAAGHLLAKK